MDNIQIRTVCQDELDQVELFINNYFVNHEPIMSSLQLCQDGYRMPYFDRWIRVRMEHPRGITLLAEDTSTGQHMGALVGFIYQRGEELENPDVDPSHRSDRCPEKFKIVLDFLDFVENKGLEKAGLLGEPRVECIFLSCRPDHRIPGLGTALLQKMHEIGRATGVEHQVVLTTSAYSARICKKLGYTEDLNLPFSDYKLNNEIVFKTNSPHTHCRFWSRHEPQR